MKYKLLICFLFLSAFGVPKGLNAEPGFNDNYDQHAKAVFCVEDYTYFVKFQKSSSFLSTCILFKIDTSGTILTSSQIKTIGDFYLCASGLPVSNYYRNEHIFDLI